MSALQENSQPLDLNVVTDVQQMRHDCVNIRNIRERLVLFGISLTYTGGGVAGGGWSRVVRPSRAAELAGQQLCRQN